MKIYVASSWRNDYQPEVVKFLREKNHQVYDFKNPEEGKGGFNWREIDENWQSWSPREYRYNLMHPLAIEGFCTDMGAMKWADVFVGVQPFGRSASLEMGWAAGQCKPTFLLLQNGEPELMVKMLDFICCSLTELDILLMEMAAES